MNSARITSTHPTTPSYQVRYAHTTQRETFSTEDAARSAVLVVYPGAHEERVDGGHSTELHYWADEAASEADFDGSRTCARIVEVQAAEVQP